MFKNHQQHIQINTRGRGTTNITQDIDHIASQSEISHGLCHIFIQHTSASLMLCENADPTVRSDLETFMSHLVPDGSSMFQHIDEGPDDMPAHVRSILTNMDLSVPITSGRLALGTWQGIYLWEHRTHPHFRNIVITCQGNTD